ncbi:MAG TPA: nuclear transport factor 2 family protein [Porticoccaceae bacterium]|nr:nuclear transport factor 2 family protein [Porticoccaceae bacterium]HIK80350.1 nuclear transport factor 2 family protein [Porticoccaceae bacterium]
MLDLEAIELIKQLKARYFRFLDTANYEGLETCFTADATAYFKGGNYEFTLNSWPELETFYRRSITEKKFGVHNGHHPEITVTGDSATGIWYLADMFINLDDNMTLRGTALYTDDYIRVGGEWKIQRTAYDRLFEEIEPRGEHLKVTVKPIGK